MSQLQELLDAVGTILDLCPPQLDLHLEEVQQEVVGRWEELRGHAEERGEELKFACHRYLFLNTVRRDGRFNGVHDGVALRFFYPCIFALQVQDYFLWCSQLISAMAAEETISDVSTADLQLAQHQQLWAEMEARQETYQQAVDMGEELQAEGGSNRKEVRSADAVEMKSSV